MDKFVVTVAVIQHDFHVHVLIRACSRIVPRVAVMPREYLSASAPVVRVGHVVVGDLGVFAPLDVPEVPAALASVVLATLAAGNVLALAEPLRARSPPRACTLVRRDNFPSLVVRSYRI